MDDSRDSGGAAVAAALVLLLVVLLGGGGVFMWMRSRQSAMAQKAEFARAQATRARAVAEQQLALAQTAAKNRTSTNGSTAKGDTPESIEGPIRSVMQSQQTAWNAGDIEKFMEHYWKSDDLTFSSGGKVTRTWQDTLKNYKTRYPSRDEMGKLTFGKLEITPLGGDAALVLGEWQLNRKSGKLGGNFSLVFRRIDEKWVIVHDHTSRSTKQKKKKAGSSKPKGS